jgi:hypothetical protein
MALILTLWVSVEERDAAGAISGVEEATRITPNFDDNSVDGLKRALVNELQPLRSRSIGTIKLYLQLEDSSDRVKLEPSWSVRPGPGTVHPLAKHELIKGKPFAAQYAGGLPNNARIVVVLPAPTAPATAPVPGEYCHILKSTKYSASCTYRRVANLFPLSLCYYLLSPIFQRLPITASSC